MVGQKLRTAPFFVFGLVCLAGFAWLAWEVDRGGVTAFDSNWIRRLQSDESDSLTQAMKGLTLLGSTLPIVIAAAVVLAALLTVRRWREAVFVVAAVGGSYAVNVWAKDLFGRERPALHRLVEEIGYGFPSGHTLAALTFFGALALLLWGRVGGWPGRTGLALAALVLAALTGASRVYLGVHYPSDIVGAFLFGGCWLAGCYGVYRWRVSASASAPVSVSVSEQSKETSSRI